MENDNVYSNGMTIQKLTEWANEPTVLVLKEDLAATKSAHDIQVGKIGNWNDLMAVRNAAKPPKIKGRSSVQPKLIRRQAEWRYSALSEPLLSSHKLFQIKPHTFEDVEASKQNELVINWQFRTKINRVKFIDDFVRSTVDEGTSVIRVGWKRITIPVMEEVPVWTYYEIQDEEQLQLLQQAIEAQTMDPRTFEEESPPELKAAVAYYQETQQPVYAKKTGTEKVEVQKVVENKPTVEMRNPANVFFDPSCGGDLDRAMFAIESFETNKADLLKEGDRYKNLDKVNWEGNTPVVNPDHQTSTPTDFRIADGLRKKIVAYEYWGFYDINKDGKLVPIVVTWIGDVIIRMEENPFPDEKIPYVVATYLPVKRELYGEPDAELLEDNQKILGAVTRGMIDLLGRSANGQQGFAKGMLDPLNRRRFDNGQDYEFNPTVSPLAGRIEHKYPELPQSALLMLNLQNQEAEALTGVKSFSGGMSGDSYGDVAAGVRGALDAASKREMGILRRLAMALSQLANKIVAMNAVFLSEEETVRITNEEFVTVKREDLKGNFDMIVDISTAEVDNAKAGDLSFMLQTMGNTLDIGITIMILSEIADLKRMPDLAERIRQFQPQPDPLVQEKLKLEVEELKMKIELLKSNIALNAAKASKLEADTDMADLDYVEQETGTKHARDIQKVEAQGRTNQDLQITKALVSPKKPEEREPNIEAAVGFNRLSENMNPVAPQRPEVQLDPMQQFMPDIPPMDEGMPNGMESVQGEMSPEMQTPVDIPTESEELMA